MQEEVTLREVINIFWRGKRLILIGTVVIAILTAIANFFILPPKYQATSTLRVGNVGETKADISSFVETARNDINIKRIMDKLNLNNGDYSITAVRDMVTISAVKDTNVMKFTVEGSNSKLITNISNLLAFETGARIEISDLSKEVLDINKKLIVIRNEISSTQKELEKVTQMFENTPEKQSVKQSLANDPYVRLLMEQQLDANARELPLLELESESINPLYTMLDERKAQVELILTSKFAEQENLETDIEEAELKISSLEQLIRDHLDGISNSERLLNGANAIFVSPAIVPTEPIGPSKLLNVLVSAVLGVVVFSVVVFFRQYLRASAVTSEK